MNVSSFEKKISRGERLTAEDGLKLYDLPLSHLGVLANTVKEKRHGKHVGFIKNYYINFTNVCKYACKYCGFRRSLNDPGSYTLTLEQIRNKLLSAPEELREVWFSSGLNSSLPYSYYLDLIKLCKETLPKAMLKAFTAVEIDYIAKHFDKSHSEVLDDFIDAGLDRIPGGGAEIFDLEIRKKIDIKTRPEDYLKIHQLMHRRDKPSSITMLFGHIESRIHRIKHMETVRKFQDESQGVQAFIPLAFQDSLNPLAKRGVKGPSPTEVLKTLAISRLMLDNIEHIQSFWIDSGNEVTQISLDFGVNDVNGTMIEENIAHESGAKTASYEKSENLISWIKSAGKIPVERDCQFGKLKILS